MGPYRALTAPAILTYFIFIILSTLRLSPAQCVLTGVLAAAGYWSVVAYTRRSFPDPPAGALETQIYITYGVVFLIGGLVAGGVARQIRVHVHAALREAETRRQVERLEHDLDIARSIQQGLLPSSPPEIDGFEIAGWSQPADQTGGDYFDWLELPDGRTIITLADVTGHGIGPALIVAVCRAYMRAAAGSGAVDLQEALGRVNDLLHVDIPEGRFVTAAVGIIDPAKGTMSMLSAGQAPLLFYEAVSGKVHNWDADDVPLGIMSGVKFDKPREIDFATGDVLVLTTDGFFEWANPRREQYGTTRMVNFLKANHALAPQAFIDELYKAVLVHAEGTEQADDLTAVVIRKT